MSYIIKIYAIRSILGGNGFLNRMLLALGIIDTAARLLRLQPQRRAADADGAADALRHPADLPVAGAHPAQTCCEASADLGASACRPSGASSCRSACRATSSAATFVFVLAIGDFLTPQMVGGHQRLHLRPHHLQPVRHRLQLAVRRRALGDPGRRGDPRDRPSARGSARQRGACYDPRRRARQRIFSSAITALVFVLLYGPLLRADLLLVLRGHARRGRLGSHLRRLCGACRQ